MLLFTEKNQIDISGTIEENKSEQVLQIIIGHIVTESYANKRSMNGRRQFMVSNVTS
jgi:hypothetical protein